MVGVGVLIAALQSSKGGVSVLRMNEPSDKLCEGSQRGTTLGQTLLSLAH